MNNSTPSINSNEVIIGSSPDTTPHAHSRNTLKTTSINLDSSSSSRVRLVSPSPSKSSSFTCKKFAKKRFPILKWLPKYKPKTDLIPDAISGVTVALTAIPQSIAYANVAGLTPEYGLYSFFVSSFVYIFLGSCRQMTIGPTALMELVVYETCGANFSSCVILIGFWIGVIQLLMGLLKLGGVVTLISDPVTIGFVAGASLTICSAEIKNFFGLTGAKGNGFIGNVRKAVENIKTISVGDTCFGIGCVIALLIMKNLNDYVKPSASTTSGQILAKSLWFLNTGRNAIVVVLSSILAYSLNDPPFALTGEVKSGLPPVAPPELELPYWPDKTNGTLTFLETWDELKTTPLLLAIVSILQNVAIAKAFGSGQSIDATQEMIALGVSHICASFFSAMPVAGSFTRSAVNDASGVRSPFGGIFTGLVVIFALSFLTRWFAYIPKASLAAVIFCAVIPMIEYENILPMWRISKLDVLTSLVTFIASLWLGMEYGIVIGVGTSLALYFIRPVQPSIACSIISVYITNSEEQERHGHMKLDSEIAYHLVKPEQGFLFPSVDAIRTKINKLALKYPDIKVIALDCERMISFDFTSASALCALVKALKKVGKRLVFLNCLEQAVYMMKCVGLEKPECFENIQDLEKMLRKEYEIETN